MCAVVEEMQRTADLEMTMARERFEVALHQKDIEVERYKVELDNILTTLLELKQQVCVRARALDALPPFLLCSFSLAFKTLLIGVLFSLSLSLSLTRTCTQGYAIPHRLAWSER